MLFYVIAAAFAVPDLYAFPSGLSASGLRLVAASTDGTTVVGLTRSGGELLRFERGTTTVVARVPDAQTLAMSPDGRTLALATRSGLRSVDVATGAVQPILGDFQSPWFLQFLPDGTLWVLSAGSEVRAAALPPGASTLGPAVLLPAPDHAAVSLDASGRLAVMRDESQVVVATLSSGLLLRELDARAAWGAAIDAEGRPVLPTSEDWRSQCDPCRELQLSRSGRWVAVADDAEVRAVAVADQRVLGRWPLAARPASMWLAEPRRIVVQLSDGRVQLIDVGDLDAPPSTTRPPGPFDLQLDALNLPGVPSGPLEGSLLEDARTPHWAHGSRSLVVAEGDTLVRVDPRTGAKKTLHNVWGSVRAAAVRQDGRVAWIHQEGTEALIVLSPDGKVEFDLQLEHDGGIAFVGDRILHGSGRQVVLRDLAGTELWTADVDRSGRALALAPDASWALAPNPGGLAVLSGRDGSVIGQLDGARPACRVAVDPTGRTVATSHSDGIIMLWSTKHWQRTHVLNGVGRCAELAFSPDGKRLAAVGGHLTVLWNATSGQAMHTYGSGGRAVAWGPDGLAVDMRGGVLIVEPPR